MATLANLTINDTGYLNLPPGTGAQRPTPSSAMLRYNSSRLETEIYAGSKWISAEYQPPTIVTNGLVCYLDAGNPGSYSGSGTQMLDISGSGLVFSIFNGPTFTTGRNSYFNFDGVNDGIGANVGTVANVFTGDFSAFVWVYRQTGVGPTWGNVIGDYYTNNLAGEWQIMISSDANLFVYRIGTGYVIPSTASGFAINQWIQVGISRIGSTITLYANANAIATATNSETWGVSTGNMNLGIDGNNSAEPLYGRISNALIYKGHGLTAAEVTQNFNAMRGRFGV